VDLKWILFNVHVEDSIMHLAVTKPNATKKNTKRTQKKHKKNTKKTQKEHKKNNQQLRRKGRLR